MKSKSKSKSKKRPTKCPTKKRVGKYAPFPTIANAPVGRRVVNADSTTEEAFRNWKSLYIQQEHAKFLVDLARSVVKGYFVALNADVIVSPTLGPIALQHRGGKVHTDWEALARKLLPAKVVEKHVSRFTTVGDGSSVLAAPSSWTAEAGFSTTA